MTEQFQVLYLSPNFTNNIQIFDLLTIQNFNSYLMAGQLVHSSCSVREDTC